ncbi:rCG22707 [Rattus norvegicus]|uniref:RCG22707 n=1 Tax=Rattus norvegicus TaxID=10116 RepID=A6JYA8_RAT|nr:rCG22707 [Rattus norvegicus]
MGLQYSIACPSDVERQGLLPSQFFLGSASHIPGQASGPPVFGQYTQKRRTLCLCFRGVSVLL